MWSRYSVGIDCQIEASVFLFPVKQQKDMNDTKFSYDLNFFPIRGQD